MNKNLKDKYANGTMNNSTISTNNKNLMLNTDNGNSTSNTADTITTRESSSVTILAVPYEHLPHLEEQLPVHVQIQTIISEKFARSAGRG